ncbi:MAG: nitrate reductase molybdenum cofactor assembly chaperone [Sterolibacterium sp.]|jgi:nitrate reductase delta subunit|nr:nitrate reductase molybdenum cofactor assembly chaperone [Sterolibacterium sp.]MBP9799504.1 nitrate reductase molybdenum cofactor assembly chaperone [Sterolibacterium sp.]
MMFYRIVSSLLEYPDVGLRAALPEIRAAAIGADDLTPEERTTLLAFLDKLEARVTREPLVLEEEYVRTFDMVPEHSMHMTHHLIGEDKNRGPALIDLGEYYKGYGFELNAEAKELPDYLPLMLEFVSLLDAEEAKLFLSRWTKVLRQLRVNLEDGGSPYADLIQLVEQRSQLVAAPDDMVEPVPAVKTDPCLDDGDFDPPVDWSSPPKVDRPHTP